MRLLEKQLLASIQLDDLMFIDAIEQSLHHPLWTKQNFADALIAGYPAFCCRIGPHIVGFIFAMIFADESHILNVAVAPDYFRQGVGSLMLTHMHQFALCRGVKNSFLEVNQNNLGAQFFYKSHEYKEIAIRKGYYLTTNGCREDALILKCSLI